MTLSFLRSYIDWNQLLQNPVVLQKLTEAAKLDRLRWELVEEMSPYIDFKAMSKDPSTPEYFLHNHSHRFDFRKLLQNNIPLSIDFIRSHPLGLRNCWDLILAKISLSEREMEEFEPFIEWKVACRYQKMSEAFIKKFKHLVDWDVIALHQSVSQEFLRENRPLEEESYS